MLARIHEEMLEWLKHLDEETQWKVLLAYVNYQIYWTEPSQNDILVYSIFKAKKFDLDSIKGDIVASIENWKKGWRPKKTFKNLNEPNQTKTQPKTNLSETEQEKEKEKENIYNPQEANLKIQQGMNSIKAERIWNLILKKWNEVMDKHEVMSTELKNRCFNFDTVDIEHIEKIMKNYKRIRDKTIEKKLESLFYFQLTEWQLVDFLKFMNKLDWTYKEVIPRLAKGDCKEIAIRKLKS